MTTDEIVEEIERHGFNVTFSGGDPLYQLPGVLELARKLTELGYTLWCYTGFLWEEVCASEEMSALFPYLEVLVDGPFRQELRDISLLFRGSSNQRLIRVAPSTPSAPILWHSEF